MKTPILYLTAIICLSFASCQKCTDCKCTESIVFDFSDSISQSDQTILENAYSTNFEDKSEEVCASRGEFDDEVAAWEEQSTEFNESNIWGGEEWSVAISYDCTCEE